MAYHFKLAFPLQTVSWDGKVLTRLPDGELEKQLKVFEECGIDRVMLAGYHLEEPSSFDMDEESQRIGQLLRSYAFTPSQHHSVCPTFSLSGMSQQLVQERLCRAVEFTANLGTDTMVIHAGRAFGHFDSVKAFCALYLAEVERIGLEALLDICAENLRIAGEFARKYGVRIALENADRAEPLCNPIHLPQLVERVGMDNVGYCLDVGHAHCWGSSIVAWIEKMKNKLFATHLHDNHGPKNTIYDKTLFLPSSLVDEHLSPGLGTIDWREVIIALREAKLEDVTFETGGWPIADKASGYRQAIAFWRLLEEQAG